MTPEHIELVKSTVPVLRENGVALTSYFYKRMLNNSPELKNVFNLDSQNSGRQPRALAAAVLAYAENIENPSVLAKAIEHITTKHVSLDIQPDQYAIVGDNLLHSISEVLNVPFESELIAAWKAAYLQLADILIGVEKQKYNNLSEQTGGWAGWRPFKITQIEASESGKIFTVEASDAQAILSAAPNQFISVKVKVPNQELEQPQQFVLSAASDKQYQFEVKAVENRTEYSVANILLENYHVGDQVQLTAPQAK
ncbi:globin domain-containing protein [Acinetobacter sp. ANC 4648]|uniref:globin domain-containing protein n=1 Tax=Acinetobacter sp. ANC 4648 TaxID=1977875 RepID=UPI000A33B1C1|nr:globin domain-containing protein [Acinetobacter sp. ANC 4648]OTG84845.1 flavohemoprotein [Acinetobacter sp. ANC 4648]